MQAILYAADTLGATFRITDIPAAFLAQAHEYRLRLIEELAEFDEDILEKYLGEEPVPAALLARAIRRGTIRSQMTPVLCGAAFRNKGVQPLLDAIIDYLPSPVDVPAITGMAVGAADPVSRPALDDAPCAALAFKVMVDPYVGHLVFVRVYSGVLEPGPQCITLRGTDENVSDAWSGCMPTNVKMCKRSAPGILGPSSGSSIR